ncbi:MAG: ATP-binding protein [Ferruginibacter sp.]
MNDLQSIVSVFQEFLLLPAETEWIEFKKNNYKPEEIGEYISALSNSASLLNKPYGYLVFGVENDTMQIAGTEFKPNQDKIGAQALENWLATLLSPRIDFRIYEFAYNEKDIVIFSIDATTNTPVEFKGEAFIRVGSYKKKLKEHPEKERKIWTKINNYTFEKGIAERGLTDDEVFKLLDYPSYYELTNQNLPKNTTLILEKFIEEKIIVADGRYYNITNLGAILFAKNIDRFDSLSRKALRVIHYHGTNKFNTVKEQIGKKGYANGFGGLLSYISGILPANEEIGQAFRHESSLYPPIAIRELVANCIIHQDFSITGTSPMVEIFENRIEITNPGKPLISTLRFIDHSPESRNEKLAKFMRRINICEERGSGIDKVITICELYQLPAPDFIEGDNFTRVILFAPKKLRQMDKKDKMRAVYQHCCLKFIIGEYMTNQSLRSRFNVDDKNYPIISRMIDDAKSEKLIRDFDSANKSRKYAKYIPFWA